MGEKIFELFAGPVGAWADALYRRTGRHLPWGVRIAIAIFWDGIDTAIRIFSWPLFFLLPGVWHVVRGVLDFFLALLGTVLWGSPGLLQPLESILGHFPAFGWFIDLIPMLTVAGFIARRRETESETEEPSRLPRAAERSVIPMPGLEILLAMVGFLVGLVTWLSGLTSVVWMLWFPLLGVAAGLLVRLFRGMEIPPRFLKSSAVAISIFLLGLAVIMGVLAATRPPESYRLAAWNQLVAAGDPEVTKAKGKDDTAKTIGAITEGISGVLRGAGETIAGALEKKTFRSPLLEKGRKALVEALTPEEPPEEPAEKPAEKKAESGIPQELAELGPAQRELYRSPYVLERAKLIANRPIAPLLTVAFLLLGILGLIGLAAVAQTTRPRGPRPGPDDHPELAGRFQ